MPITRRSNRYRPPRNTAPMWKKLSLVVGTVVVLIVVISLLHASKWPFLAFFALVIVVAAAAVWGLAKLLGVRLSLGSWD